MTTLGGLVLGCTIGAAMWAVAIVGLLRLLGWW